MSNILDRKFARKSDSDFVVAAARAIYCDWYLSDERREAAVSGPRVELTEVIPSTQRWAFRQARAFTGKLLECKHDSQFLAPRLEAMLTGWFIGWKGDRESSEENAGWYAAMQAMGHGVGLSDAGGIKVDLPHLEASPQYSERELMNRGWTRIYGKLPPPEGW